MTSTAFQDNQNLSENNGSNLTQFIGQDGNEFVINTTTGDAFISQSASGRLLEVSEWTIRDNVKSLDLITETAVINTPAGKRSSRLISATDFYKLAEKYKPELAKQMLKAGANLYIYGLAGYKISLSEPEPVKPILDLAEVAQAYLDERKQRMVLEAKIEADSEATALGEFLNKGEGLIGMGEMARILEIGRNRLFIELREMGIMMQGKVIPYQWCHEAGYFKVTETLDNNGDIVMVTLITPKGQKYLAKRHKKFLANEWMVVRVEKELNLA